jgi:hypothetical protein
MGRIRLFCVPFLFSSGFKRGAGRPAPFVASSSCFPARLIRPSHSKRQEEFWKGLAAALKAGFQVLRETPADMQRTGRAKAKW